jgi:putative serine/threonine protein kinase
LNNLIKTDNLLNSKVKNYLCYPNYLEQEMINRVNQLKTLGIDAISLGGPHKIMGYHVLGKGHTGVVLNAVWNKKNVALKARRTDANRHSMKREAAMLKISNSVDVGPLLYGYTNDFLIMEKLVGPYFGDWIKVFDGSKHHFFEVIRDLLLKIYRLDQVGLDHGELNKIRRHFIVTDQYARVIDFESASTKRRVQNVTSTVQSMFMNQKITKVMKQWINLPIKEDLIKCLKDYKENITKENFNKIIHILGLNTIV